MSSEQRHPTPFDFYLGDVKCSTHTIAQFVDAVRDLLENPANQPRSLLCVNAHIYNLAWTDPLLRETLNNAGIVTADGMSIVLMSGLRGVHVPKRCNMTEAFRAFLVENQMPKSRAILIGVSQDEADAAAKTIGTLSSHCRVVRSYSGFLPDDFYERVFLELKDVDFIMLGMGTPRTERICDMARAICPNAIVWGIGAGTIRIFAGAVKEAPFLLRRTGFQWLYRLLSEPARLWRRYLIGNPLFVWRVLSLTLFAKTPLAGHPELPPSEHSVKTDRTAV
jgi:exopolysaccharide biosynthesis WecB/TagA/CpsF family protein